MSSPLRVREVLRLLSVMSLAALVFGALSSCSKKEDSSSSAAPPAVTTVARAALPAKCEPGADGKCAPSALCSPDCKTLATPDCAKCEAAGDCSAFATACENPMLSAEDKQTCYDILTCVESSRCFEGPKATLGSCYCGELDLRACMAAPFTGPGAPKGVCHDLILKGMPTAKSHGHVLANLTMRDRAAGFALSRVNCQKFGYKQACASVCGWLPQR